MNHTTTPETPNSVIVSEFPRCQHRTCKGRCRELPSDPLSSLCFKHSADLKKVRDTVMAYTCSLRLRTLPVLDRELHTSPQEDNTVVFDIDIDIDSAVARRAAEA